MKTFNTLLLIQNAEGQNVQEQTVVEQPVIEQGQIQETHTTEPAQNPDAAPAQEAPKEKGFGSWIFILLIIVVFYFFLIRPQSKRAKDERKFREALKKGDKIVTTAGIHGKLLELDDTTAVIETEGQGRLRIEKAAIVKHQPS